MDDNKNKIDRLFERLERFSSSQMTSIVVVVGCMVLIGWFIAGRRNPQPLKITGLSPPPAASPSTAPRAVPAAQPPLAGAEKQLAERPQLFGMKQRRLEKNSEGVMLPVSIVWQNGCGKKPRAAVRREVSAVKDQNAAVLLSVEQLSPIGPPFAPITRTVSTDSLLRGLNTVFTLPFSSRTQHFGLFVCLNENGRASCFESAARKSRRFSAQQTGGVYFFGHFALLEDRLYVLDFTRGTQVLRGLTRHLAETGVPKEQQESLVSLITGFKAALRTRDLRTDTPLVQAVLTQDRPSWCPL